MVPTWSNITISTVYNYYFIVKLKLVHELSFELKAMCDMCLVYTLNDAHIQKSGTNKNMPMTQNHRLKCCGY